MSQAAPEPAAIALTLQQRRRELQREIDERELSPREAAAGDHAVHDAKDDADADASAAVRSAEVQRDRAEIARIDAALRRIQAGGYGTCERCGEPIASARLAAAPASVRCAACEAAVEHDRLPVRRA